MAFLYAMVAVILEWVNFHRRFRSIILRRLHNYAATKLGDVFYYENLDNLKPISKLQFILRFIMKTELDKSSRLYMLVHTLFRNRNTLVHNKSADGSDIGMTEEEYGQWEAFAKTNGGKELLEQDRKVELSYARGFLSVALDALRALKEIGDFFDKNDSSSFASALLLMSGGFVLANENDIGRIRAVQEELGVPMIDR